MKRLFPQFDVDYISGVMSLRRPQKTSLKRLADILEEEFLKLLEEKKPSK